MVSSNGNVQPTFLLNLHIGDVQWECSIGFSTQLTHWELPVGTINQFFTSTYTLEASSGNVQSAFQLSLHTGSFQWERSINFSPQPTHWKLPVGMFNRLFNSAYTLGASTEKNEINIFLNLHVVRLC